MLNSELAAEIVKPLFTILYKGNDITDDLTKGIIIN